MTVTLNAVAGTGLVQTSDASGIIKVQSAGVTTNALAWVNFNGTLSSPITPRANYNISSVTKNGTGDYTLNFTTALSDANYAPVGISDPALNVDNLPRTIQFISFSTSALRISTNDNLGVKEDSAYVNLAIFGN